jgi:hypothetical protein
MAQGYRKILGLDPVDTSAAHCPADDFALFFRPDFEALKPDLKVFEAIFQCRYKSLVVQARADHLFDKVGEVGDPLERVAKGLVINFAILGFEPVGENQIMANFCAEI